MATDFRERFPQYWTRGSRGHILCWGGFRNSYGCEILNASGAIFVDIDRQESPEKRPGLLTRLF